MITEEQVREALNEIVDPCSVAAGVPAGLNDMGLVRRVEIGGEPHGSEVDVVIGITEFGCVMGGPFARKAHQRLLVLDGVEKVNIEVDPGLDWQPADMTPEYRERLSRTRDERRRAVLARGVELPVLQNSGGART